MLSNPILIIEDDEDDATLIMEALETTGTTTQVNWFSRSDEALKFLRQTKVRPSLILCDVNMPHMNGIEFKKELNKDKEADVRQSPFIYLSTSDELSLLKQAEAVNAHSYFKKPSSFKELKNLMNIIVEYWQNCAFVRKLN